ncbi:E3 ubiquitin-protein ligase ZNF598 isoform X2 [Vespula pensylvanica]|uniref:E3 ubiquitin-protein ligase ZNF598 isoform X2 n=1 Tax=Vespula pensylvanica TaxID=30213 RepID=UPI001CB9F91F|nr:E3 ubiquitin-protein ligase ZNF598 isoform X2 [Vespula pensylvanica]
MSASNESVNTNTCVVCYKNVEIYSIGMCEHPVCYECSTRMRVLCRQNECPICRQDLPKVVFTREIKPFRFLRKGGLLDTRYDIYFDTVDIQEKFYELLADVCTICEEKKVFSNFQSLKDHMRHQHELHYCDLCVENLKIFSCERRCYTRSELAQHRRKGDIDDRSHKGHPLCEFCDQRYMDNDELYRHLRRDHLYCHFCDADGLHQYYSSYEYLRDHFRQEHFLCEEGMCVDEKFTSVFRTDIDLKAHKTSVHGKQLSKAAAKQARTLELEFTLAPRGENRIRRGMPGPSTSKSTRDYGFRDHNTREYQQPMALTSSSNSQANIEAANTFIRQPSVDVQSREEFPTLVLGCNKPSTSTPNSAQWKEVLQWTCTKSSSAVAPKSKKTIRSLAPSPPPIQSGEDFPSLSKSSKQNKQSAVMVVPSWVQPQSSGISNNNIKSTTESAKGKAKKKKAKHNANVNETNNTKPNKTSADIKKNCESSSNVAGSSQILEPTNNSLENSTKHNNDDKQNGQSSNDTCNDVKNSHNIKNSKEVEHTNKKDKKKCKNLEEGSCAVIVKTSSENSNTTNNILRKRTELKIDSLNSTNNNNVHQIEDFPALGSSGSRPPGFIDPPPGFESTTSPPPGFCIKVENMEQLHSNNGLTFTNSSGESYAILPSDYKHNTIYTYILPPDFQKRNKSLVAKMNEVLMEQDRIEKFRYISGLFRQGVCSAEEYYAHCCTVMGRMAVEDVFPELLVLLPDISKQQELFKVYKKELDNKVKGLEICATCNQILKNSDFQTHMVNHTLENHFPVLGKNNTGPNKNMWVRK